MKTLILLLACLCLLGACQQEVNYFNGEMHTVKLPAVADTLDGRELHFDEVQTGNMFVYDSLLFFTSSKFPGYLVSVFNAKTGKHLANCFGRGQGPYEFYDLSFIRYVNHVDGCPHLYAYSVNDERLIDIDITTFLKDLGRTGKVDYSAVQVQDCSWSAYHTAPFNYQYPVDEKHLWVKTSFELSITDGEEPILPAYERIDREKKQVTQRYPIFAFPVQNGNLPDVYPSFFYLSTDAIHPGGKQAAMAMLILPQMNITNLETGKMTCHQISGMLKQDVSKASRENIYLYYLSTVADRQFIYTLFVNKPLFEAKGEEQPQGNEIHVYDWSGNLVKRWHLPHEASEIKLDFKGKFLYAKNNVTDQVYVYELP